MTLQEQIEQYADEMAKQIEKELENNPVPQRNNPLAELL